MDEISVPKEWEDSVKSLVRCDVTLCWILLKYKYEYKNMRIYHKLVHHNGEYKICKLRSFVKLEFVVD